MASHSVINFTFAVRKKKTYDKTLALLVAANFSNVFDISPIQAVNVDCRPEYVSLQFSHYHFTSKKDFSYSTILLTII